jgi:hypothetical protein
MMLSANTAREVVLVAEVVLITRCVLTPSLVFPWESPPVR